MKLASTNPGDFSLITDDVDRFWQAFDSPDWPDSLEDIYFDQASLGLRDFIKLRIGDTSDLLEVVTKHSDYYRSIRANVESAADQGPAVRKVYQRLNELLPQAVFPDVYFLIGRLNSGGTIAESGILIGLEMFAYSPGIPVDGLSKWQRTAIKPPEALPQIVAHELVHVEQYLLGDPDAASSNLLSMSISEGVADFLGEMISDKHINHHIHSWARHKERELWQEFQRVMHGTETTGWLYSTSDDTRPADLGYFLGYRIAESYYEQQSDKQQATANLVSIKDFAEFLKASNYRP